MVRRAVVTSPHPLPPHPPSSATQSGVRPAVSLIDLADDDMDETTDVEPWRERQIESQRNPPLRK